MGGKLTLVVQPTLQADRQQYRPYAEKNQSALLRVVRLQGAKLIVIGIVTPVLAVLKLRRMSL